MAGVEMAWRLAPTLLSAVSFAVIKGIATRQLKGSLISKEAKPTEVEALGDRAVGFLHALVSSMAALWLMGVEQSTGVGLDAAHLCEPMPGFRQLSAFSSGYFLFDLYMSIQGWGVVYVLHASLSLITYLIPVFSDYCHRYACGFLLFELSTLPFHMASFTKGYLAKTLDRQTAADHPAVKALERIFSAVFIVARIGFGFWFSWRFHVQAIAEPEPACIHVGLHNYIRIANLLFNLLNSFWAVKIVHRLIYGTKSKGAGIQKED